MLPTDPTVARPVRLGLDDKSAGMRQQAAKLALIHSVATVPMAQPNRPRKGNVTALAASNQARNTLLGMLERLGCGYAVLDDCKRIVEANATARKILEREDETSCGKPDRYSRALQTLVGRARGRLPVGSLSWLAVSFKEGTTIALRQVLDFTSDGTRVVILLDLDTAPAPNPATLQQIFGLTGAEASLAVLMAQGHTPDEVAQSRQVSRTTIRSQLASIFAKTQTRRQAELVSLLGRIAALP